MLLLLIVVPCVVMGVAAVLVLNRTGLLPRLETTTGRPVALQTEALRRRAYGPERRPWYMADRLQTVVAVMLVASFLVPVLVLDLLAAVVMSVSQSGGLPAPRPIVGAQVSQVFDANGNEIASYQQFTTNIPVAPEDIPQVLKSAVVAAEDRRFYQHKGIDPRALLRALWADLTGGHYAQGASTIDQQYVRLVYGGTARTLHRKVQEAVLAGRVDAHLSKDEILYGYLQRAYFGGGAYGIGAAADTYFRKSVKDLSVSEAATLASILPAPTQYDPRVDPIGADERRRQVLSEMAQQHLITREQAAIADSERLVIAGSPDIPAGPATVINPPRTEQSRYPWFTDYVRRYLVARYGPDVLSRGLNVQTSLDPGLQALADSVVGNTLKGTDPPLDMAMVVIDPKTGLVKAIVGGRDFSKSQVNLALGSCPPVTNPVPPDQPICIAGGGSGRQPGSSFKPFTLAKAFESGLDANKVYNGPATYTFPAKYCQGAGCTVKNVESGGFGPITLRQATTFSVNTVFAQLIEDIGVTPTAEMAHRLGVTMINPSGRDNSGRPYGASLTLGSADVSPLDMAAAYSVFANRGVQLPASPVTLVTAADGTVLEDNRGRVGKQVISTAVADQVNDVLKDVINVPGGTGNAANIGRPNGAAGKTGTTESFSDAWFVGYTPQLAASVWMGDTNGRQPLVNIKGVPQVFGGTFPAQTWQAFMAAAVGNLPEEDFVSPNPPATVPSNLPTVPTGTTVPGFPTSTVTTNPLLTIPGATNPTDTATVPFTIPQTLPTYTTYPTIPTTPPTVRPTSTTKVP